MRRLSWMLVIVAMLVVVVVPTVTAAPVEESEATSIWSAGVEWLSSLWELLATFYPGSDGFESISGAEERGPDMDPNGIPSIEDAPKIDADSSEPSEHLAP